MTNQIQSIPLAQLIPHPDNPNRMSRVTFTKLVRNIGQTGRYEPLIVRRITDIQGHISGNVTNIRKNTYESDVYQIINGHHRWQALRELGYKTADAIVWEVDDRDTDILLATLNRLGGSDVLEKKLALLSRLNKQMRSRDLAKLLPLTRPQIERLISLKGPTEPANITVGRFANPLVFFVSDKQQKIVEDALSLARQAQSEKTKAAKNAAALTCIAQCFIRSKGSE